MSKAQLILVMGVVPRKFDAGDIDNDGTVDLVVGVATGDILIFLNQGDDTFSPPRKSSLRLLGLRFLDLARPMEMEFLIFTTVEMMAQAFMSK